jgi:nitronate monooxygenase
MSAAFPSASHLSTRLTRAFQLTTPIVAAPMALASGGALAAACANAGALGLVAGGYGDLAWTRREVELGEALLVDAAARKRFGVGFIVWTAEKDASAIDWVMGLPAERQPAAMFLSFAADGASLARWCRRVKDALPNTALIYQVQTLAQAQAAADAGADAIAAQGGEAGGHGMNPLDGRAVMTFVPEVADWLAKHHPQTLLLAAGGVADGRGLAASLALGADGAVVGSRLWATQESLAADGAKQLATQTNGDGTARTAIFDILRRKNWPAEYDFRAIRNALHRQWEGRVDELRAAPDAARAEYDAGVAAKDFTRAHATVGEATALIHDVPSAGELIARMTAEARAVIDRLPR